MPSDTYLFRGLIIDEDSFDSEEIGTWLRTLNGMYSFRTTASYDTFRKIAGRVNGSLAYLRDIYEAGDSLTFYEYGFALETFKIKPTDMAVLSKDIHFLENAMSFMACTILVYEEEITYEVAGTTPDFIAKNLTDVQGFLQGYLHGYLGEMIWNQTAMKEHHQAGRLKIYQNCYGGYQLHILGRYYGRTHERSDFQLYSNYMRWNKAGRCKGDFDKLFASLFLTEIDTLPSLEGYAICAVPSRPGEANRFDGILREITASRPLENIQSNFRCTKIYPSQKSFTDRERKRNVAGAFKYKGILAGKTVILLDDIIATGWTIHECVRVLKGAGAYRVIPIILAANQLRMNSLNIFFAVHCPICGNSMILRINSRKKKPFYSCDQCKSSTLDYEKGIDQLKAQFNSRVADLSIQAWQQKRDESTSSVYVWNDSGDDVGYLLYT